MALTDLEEVITDLGEVTKGSLPTQFDHLSETTTLNCTQYGNISWDCPFMISQGVNYQYLGKVVKTISSILKFQ